MTDVKNKQASAKPKKTKMEVLLYVIAVIMAIIGVYMIYAQIMYMENNAKMYGMGTMEAYGVIGILQLMISNCFNYFAFAVVVATAGMIYGQGSAKVSFETKMCDKLKETEACETVTEDNGATWECADESVDNA